MYKAATQMSFSGTVVYRGRLIKDIDHGSEFASFGGNRLFQIMTDWPEDKAQPVYWVNFWT